ncbi:MAG: hypothetical protein P9E24_00990 [Candidatus Competibacter sp.]|nr:hypothetical protein [Candidatus Competibacter sp.]MDG4584625.1 hypothetical protein [Candidatus Competibacter sp.]
MKTILISSAVVLSMASLAVSAEEMSSSFSWGNVTFQPRAYVGYADYNLKGGSGTFTEGNSPPQSGKPKLDFFDHDKISFSGLIWGIGGTAASGRFFGDIYYQATPNETAYSGTQSQITEGGFTVNRSLGDVEAKHDDWALSLGYLITDQWSVFAGYKAGKTDWDQSMLYYVEAPNLRFNVTLDGEFTQDGPFLGTSYSFPIGPGTLTLKAAYAYLDGIFKRNVNAVISGSPEGASFVTSNYKLDGNSNAYSLGISWTQALADNLGFSIGANYHSYDFNLSGSSTGTVVGVPGLSPQTIQKVSLTEELFTITASLVYHF